MPIPVTREVPLLLLLISSTEVVAGVRDLEVVELVNGERGRPERLIVPEVSKKPPTILQAHSLLP